MATPTTAGTGVQFPKAGSSEKPSQPTGPRTASVRSDRDPAEPELGSTAPSPRNAPSQSGTRARAARRRKSSGRRLFSFDRRLGVELVAGADEAGRGCLAGPLVAAAVLFDHRALTVRELRSLSALNDSKQHTAETRERLYPLVLRAAARVSVISRCARGIDSTGLHKTNLAALRQALLAVTEGVEEPLICLVDGFSVAEMGRPQRAIVDGDATSAAIAAASIVAKVTRDRFMRRAEELHPGWGFAEHVGYSTPDHRDAIMRQGVSPLHRRSFQSIAYQQLTL